MDSDRIQSVTSLSESYGGMQRTVVVLLLLALVGIGLWIYHTNVVGIRSMQLRRAELKASVKAVAQFLSPRLEGLSLEADDSSTPLAERHAEAAEALAELEALGGQDYYFIIDAKGRCWADGGNPSLALQAAGVRPGPSLFGIDPERTKTAENMVDAANSGGGFVEYKWASPEHRGDQVPKMCYMEQIPGIALYLGRATFLG